MRIRSKQNLLLQKKIELYRHLLLIRKAEEKIAWGVETKKIIGPCHLSIGQEAIAVGIARSLRSTDRVFGSHRSHSHILSMGGEPFKLFSEVLGKRTGFSKGFGGSMHLSAPALGFWGSVPIVGGTLPIALGAAFAAKKDDSDSIAVVYFGDGATEEGIFHESLNLASVFELPVLFVCENNLFSSHLHLQFRQPSLKTTRFAKAHQIVSVCVDGNDVEKVESVGRHLVEKIRKTRKPAYLEALTYRTRGHVGHRLDLEVGLNRQRDMKEWKQRDPLLQLKRGLSQKQVKTIETQIDFEIETAWKRAFNAKQPKRKNLLKPVFSSGVFYKSPTKQSRLPGMVSYSEALLEAHEYLLENYKDVFVIGQGVTSPWYVGNTLKDLDKKFGTDRILDTPVSEDGVTGLALGASLCGYRPIVVHPRFDFLILAANTIVNQAAKWGYMFGGGVFPKLTIRAILNRGGEQGAQHSQAFHSWFMHVPGLRVIMPASPLIARDLFIASVLCNDPVLFIEDRWLYEKEERWKPIVKRTLQKEGARCLHKGTDLTLVGTGYSTELCLKARKHLRKAGISVEVFDLPVLNPLELTKIVASVQKTRRFLVVDGSWRSCGLAGEVIASVLERIDPVLLLSRPSRVTLPNCPAPSSGTLEKVFYPSVQEIVTECLEQFVPIQRPNKFRGRQEPSAASVSPRTLLGC